MASTLCLRGFLTSRLADRGLNGCVVLTGSRYSSLCFSFLFFSFFTSSIFPIHERKRTCAPGRAPRKTKRERGGGGGGGAVGELTSFAFLIGAPSTLDGIMQATRCLASALPQRKRRDRLTFSRGDEKRRARRRQEGSVACLIAIPDANGRRCYRAGVHNYVVTFNYRFA